MNHKEIKKRHAEITSRYLAGKTLQEFGDAIGRKRQEVYMWKVGKQSPPPVMLMKIVKFQNGASWVVGWAKECLDVYLDRRNNGK